MNASYWFWELQELNSYACIPAAGEDLKKHNSLAILCYWFQPDLNEGSFYVAAQLPQPTCWLEAKLDDSPTVLWAA